ncbi:MAG: 3-oxoacid CoA-transferase subunit B [Firmicutes bacterium]|jgi:acetate CoA/acetoacetate CoA-transferase beta subunit|nr:3-oxoacid CoA-transferase subunit B [Bacillota bacterium]MDH7496464.1 3-oxoacid CoA-transferase subunit B [Bacillota bacterium]
MGADASRELIARRVARELRGGEVVNLGIGTPTLVANYITPEMDITLHSENGFVGLGPAPPSGQEIPDLVNAGGQPVTVVPGACFFDTAMSFAIIRGGHVDVTVLGALEVDEEGSLANWWIPGKGGPGMGGGMDLVVGAKRVIVAMEHTRRDGAPKIVRRCTMPVTAKGEVNLIVTDMAVIEVTKEGLVLREVAPGVSTSDVLAKTEARLIVPDDVREMSI